MRRFLWDLCIIVCILLIGTELNDTHTYVKREEKLKTFEQSLKQEDTPEKQSVIVYQIEEDYSISIIEKETPSGSEPKIRITEVIRPQPIPKIILPFLLMGDVE